MMARIAERDHESPAVESPPESPYMRMGEVMKRAGLSSSKIYELVRKQEFPKWLDLPKIGSGWLKADVEGWLVSKPSLMSILPRRQAPPPALTPIMACEVAVSLCILRKVSFFTARIGARLHDVRGVGGSAPCMFEQNVAHIGGKRQPQFVGDFPNTGPNYAL
jgi:predicted DNA-binding transcriptional regulator AlpA